LHIISEAVDGQDAVQKAKQLQPDLILLDIGLPDLNGIEVNRLIPEISPNSKIIFLTENRDVDFVIVAINDGAKGYVLKSDGVSELLRAIETVLQGGKFVSRHFNHGKCDWGRMLLQRPTAAPMAR